MSQQLQVLLREKNDPLKALIGQSFNSKTKDEALKILNEIHSVAKHRSLDKKALCYVTNDDEIKGVGGSTMLQDKDGKITSNLILDQFGIALAGILKGGVSANIENLQDTGNVARLVRFYNTATTFNDSNSARMVLQLGDGLTAPTRADFKIESQLPSAPETNAFTSTVPTYNATNFNWKNTGVVTASGSGTVNEAIMIALWQDSAPVLRNFALYRDIISPGQVFTPSDTLTLEYTTQI